jgi:hypothetical protein
MVMDTFHFTIEITKPTIIEDVASERLCVYCNDALFGVSNNKYTLEFDRKAPSYYEAVQSAKINILDSGIGSDIIQVELQDFSHKYTDKIIKKIKLTNKISIVAAIIAALYIFISMSNYIIPLCAILFSLSSILTGTFLKRNKLLSTKLRNEMFQKRKILSTGLKRNEMLLERSWSEV